MVKVKQLMNTMLGGRGVPGRDLNLLLGLREPERSNRLSLFLLSPWGCLPPRLVPSHLQAHVHSHRRSAGKAGEP